MNHPLHSLTTARATCFALSFALTACVGAESHADPMPARDANTVAAPHRTLARAGQHGTLAGRPCDIDGDGAADSITGAEDPSADAGRAYVHLGGASLHGIPAPVVLEAPGDAVDFGASVACVPDLNGDGRSDVVVGAPGADGETGRAYVFLSGDAGLGRVPNVVLRGSAAMGRFGFTVAGVGDVNGDGLGDLAVGAYNANGGAGRVDVYLGNGSSGTDPESAVALTPEGMGGQFGFAIAGLGDVDGDGLADVAVGADGWSDRRGRVYVYRGTNAVRATGMQPALVLEGMAAGSSFGVSVAAAGDVNGDGLADLIVGAQGMRGGRGGAYVYLGNANALSSVPAAVLAPTGGERAFGTMVAPAGDVDGDGLDDVQIASAAGASQPEVYYGAVRGMRSAVAR